MHVKSKLLIIPLLLSFVLVFTGRAEAGGIPLKVVILTTYTVEDIGRVPMKYSLEIKRWYDRNFADAEYYRVRGTDSYLYIKDGLAFITIAKGKSGSVRSVSALLKDKRFGFADAYFIVTGGASVPPHIASTGSVCIAEWVLDREYRTSVVKKGKKKIVVAKSGSFFRLNDNLARWALLLNRNTKLADNARAARHRNLYKAESAKSAPSIYLGTSVTASPKRTGRESSRFAERLCVQHSAGRYGVLQEEDNAIAYVLKQSGHLNRLLIMRSGIDFDQTPHETSQLTASGAFAIGAVNNYRAAAPLVKEILHNWSQWKSGVPAFDTGRFSQSHEGHLHRPE